MKKSVLFPVAFVAVLTLSLTAAAPSPAAPDPAQARAGAAARAGGQPPLTLAGRRAELMLVAVSPQTVRISLAPLSADGSTVALEDEPVLVKRSWPAPALKLRSLPAPQRVKVGRLQVTVSPNPLVVKVEREGVLVQELRFESDTGAFTFSLGDGSIFGLGEGGPQYDRRGSFYRMRSGQGAYRPDTIGARVPIPWLIGTAGWAMFVHEPLGTFDLTGKIGRFARWGSSSALPVDVFVVGASEPAQIMAEYARLTGQPHMPPLWALGYQQSHRTLVSRDAVLSVGRTLREKKLPCDVLIYLGTGFCPSGWNTPQPSFTWNPRAFPDPQVMLREMHENNFKIILHVVDPPEGLHGGVADTDVAPEEETAAANYWRKHLDVFRLGIDGWWPDEGDRLEIDPRLTRNRMYWEGPQLERPNQRTYALHRNGYAGIQRYGWLWSGDVDSTWKTLEAQVQVGINAGLSGIPYWGTDTGGFVTTPELTGELYVRWFQFSAFCPLFRSHGRTWRLRLPYGWNTGELGPPEMEGYGRNSGPPATKELFNPEVEPICRKYLDLRYRLLPYLYTAVRESHDTGMPIMRALWLQYADDIKAVQRGDEYLWGRDLLVAPVTEEGATSRAIYLPRGLWYDFWTQAKVEGGREVARPVDLATLPLYVRAGAIVPLGPVKQYTSEKTDEPLTIVVYPGADGQFVMYEDDGTTFNYEKGEAMRVKMIWEDSERRLSLSLAEGSKMLPPLQRKMVVQLAAENVTQALVFEGRPVDLKF